MKNQLIFSLLLLLSPLFIRAQIETSPSYGGDPNKTQPEKVIQPTQLNKGIYMSFSDLKYNQPSNQRPFEYKVSNRNFSIPSYQLRYTDEKKKKEKKAFGFSDGKLLFINANTYGNGNYYTMIEEIGRFLFFRDAGGGGIGLGGGIALGPVAIGTGGGNRIRAYILDIESGETTTLNAKKMKVLLSRFPNLSQAFEKEKQRNNPEQLKKYIQLLNNQYRIEAEGR